MRYIILSKNKTYVYSLNEEQFNKLISILKKDTRCDYKIIDLHSHYKVCQFKMNATLLSHYVWLCIKEVLEDLIR